MIKPPSHTRSTDFLTQRRAEEQIGGSPSSALLPFDVYKHASGSGAATAVFTVADREFWEILSLSAITPTASVTVRFYNVPDSGSATFSDNGVFEQAFTAGNVVHLDPLEGHVMRAGSTLQVFPTTAADVLVWATVRRHFRG